MRSISRAVIFLFVALYCLGCSGPKSPLVPDGSFNFASSFDSSNKWVLWDSNPMWIQHKNVDLSVIVDGDELITYQVK